MVHLLIIPHWHVHLYTPNHMGSCGFSMLMGHTPSKVHMCTYIYIPKLNTSRGILNLYIVPRPVLKQNREGLSYRSHLQPSCVCWMCFLWKRTLDLLNTNQMHLPLRHLDLWAEDWSQAIRAALPRGLSQFQVILDSHIFKSGLNWKQAELSNHECPVVTYFE